MDGVVVVVGRYGEHWVGYRRRAIRQLGMLMAAAWVGFDCGCELPTARVAGTARNARTLQPLAGVEIEWQGQRVTTNSDGEYAFTMPVGVQELRVSHQEVEFSTIVVVTHTKWKQGLTQEQDVLVPARVSKERWWSVSFLPADFKAFEGDVGSGLLVTNADGSPVQFLDLDAPLLRNCRNGTKRARCCTSPTSGKKAACGATIRKRKGPKPWRARDSCRLV